MASNSWGLQTPVALIGTEAVPVALTTSYTGQSATFTATAGVRQITFYIQYVPTNASNSIQWKIEGSGLQPVAGTIPNFYQDTSESITTGVDTVSAKSYTYAPAATAAVYIKNTVDINDMNIKISVKETVGGGTAGTVSVYALSSANQ